MSGRALLACVHCCRRELRLRIGTQVILLVNLRPELKLINGSRGIVIRFAAPRELNLDADEARAVEQYVSKQPAVCHSVGAIPCSTTRCTSTGYLCPAWHTEGSLIAAGLCKWNSSPQLAICKGPHAQQLCLCQSNQAS